MVMMITQKKSLSKRGVFELDELINTDVSLNN